MIRNFKKSDLSRIMQIWLDTNIKAHSFIPKEYWTENFDLVKNLLPQAEVYVFEDDITNIIGGFVGITENYIAGIFVSEKLQSKGIGKQLLDFVKTIKNQLTLNVYQKNERAVNFYCREDFTIQSINSDKDTGEKELLMLWKR